MVEMETSRFFVANLPPKTSDKDLRRLFQDYGVVTHVDLKTKKNLVDPEDVSIIAFVTLQIGADDAQYCLNELKWQKVHGAQIKVSLARESFLDRLKREREEATTVQNPSLSDVATENTSMLLQPKNLANTRKTFGEDVDFGNEDEIAPELMITKKRAASSLHHGKIVIQSFDVTPLHVIETKQQSKQLDAKSVTADQKRKESLIKMKHGYQQKKSAIQQALANLNAAPAKKIKFSDAEETDDEVGEVNQAKSSTNIFGSDDEMEGDSNLELNLKPQHFGKKGEKLMQLQSRQSLDPRFRIDEQFVDDDDDDLEDNDDGQVDESSSRNVVKPKDTTENERDWQMNILQQVVGTQIDTGNATQKAAKNKKMLRFDPAKDDHQKYLRQQAATVETNAKQKEKNSKKQKKLDKLNGIENATDAAAEPAPLVSKDVFYVVTDTLAQSLKTRGDGFSLLNMFGSNDEILQQRENQLKQISNAKILVNNVDKNALNPFHYDSSSADEAYEEAATKNEQQHQKNAQAQNKLGDKNKQEKKARFCLETFFIPRNDNRLREGAKFFKYTKSSELTENYEEVRNRLKLLIKTKIKKTQKNLAKQGVKGKMRKKF